jgi:hypothetical protein
VDDKLEATATLGDDAHVALAEGQHPAAECALSEPQADAKTQIAEQRFLDKQRLEP